MKTYNHMNYFFCQHDDLWSSCITSMSKYYDYIKHFFQLHFSAHICFFISHLLSDIVLHSGANDFI